MRTGLEPATSGVTGRHSNQLNYRTRIPLWESLSGFLPDCECKVTTFFSLPQIFMQYFSKNFILLHIHRVLMLPPRSLREKKEQHVVETNNVALPLSSAVRTGLEPATSGVTGRHSNQLNYRTRIPLWESLSGFLPDCECKVTTFFSFPQIFPNIFSKKSEAKIPIRSAMAFSMRQPPYFFPA